MLLDDAGGRIYLLTITGLTVVDLDEVPLSIGSVQPAVGPISGGTQVTIRGSGFVSGMTVSFGTQSASATRVDSSTLLIVTPPASSGAVRVTLSPPSGAAYSVDAGFVYQ